MSTLPLFDRQPVFAVDPPKLRPYQSHAIQLLRDRVREGKRRIMLVMPTGGGKMVLAASVIRTATVPVLFVAHRLELIDQCVAQLAALGITNVGVMRADDERTDPNAATQIASIQTLARRKKPPAGLVLIDECHRSASDSYTDLIFEHYREAIILGFTATPSRFDGRPLGNLFECMEVVTTYAELIREGFIVAPECYGAPSSPDMTGMRVVGGDFDEGELGDAMISNSLIGNIVDHWGRLAHMYPNPCGAPGFVEGPRRRTFVFATNIRHSREICERFGRAGVRVAHLDGDTPEAQRRSVIQAIGRGDVDVVSNVGVLLEGTDVPSVKCVVHARPTLSLVLWRQSAGRALRPWHPGCPPGCVKHPSVAPLLLDHAGNIDRHGFPHEDLHWELSSRARKIETKIATKFCKACFAYVPAARIVCPYCGVQFPPAPKVETPQEKEAQLVRRSTTPEDMKRAFYDDIVKTARKLGHKPGFAAAKFKDHYGTWPPWAWSEATRASFASDPDWQATLEAKRERKDRKAREDAAHEAATELDVDLNDALEESPAEPEPARATPITQGDEAAADAPFADWLREQGIG